MSSRRLTEEEKAEIVKMRGLGYSQKEIAAELEVSQGTIQYQLKKINKHAEKVGKDKTFLAAIKSYLSDYQAGETGKNRVIEIGTSAKGDSWALDETSFLTLKEMAKNYANEPVDQRDKWVVIERKLDDPCVEFENEEVRLIVQGLHSLEEWYYEKISEVEERGTLSQTDVFNRRLWELKKNRIERALESLELKNIGKFKERTPLLEPA